MEAYEQLEQQWVEFNRLDPADMVCCSSGTAALHLALEAMQLPVGSEVIVPDFTMVACPRAIIMAGLTPVFVDCGLDLNIDPQLLQFENFGGSSQGKYLSAMMAVHIYGRKCNMEAIYGFNQIMEARVIEDLAEAHGVRPHLATDAACWSFYHNKIVAGEEGGAVWFRNPKHAALARQLRNLGFTDAHDFNHVPRGHNYRMSNVHAAWIIGGSGGVSCKENLGGLRFYTWNLERRRVIESWYDEYCPDNWRMPPRDAPWVYDMRIKGMSWRTQDRVVKTLNDAGIGARHGFKPMHLQEEFKGCRFVYGRNGHKSSILSNWTMYLPIQPGVTTEDDCRRAFQIIREIIAKD